MGQEKYQSWPKITVEELKAFLGFSVLMSINSLPALKDYWKRDPTYHYAPIASRISRDRFLEVSRYLHFVDNDTLEPRESLSYDRLGKVHPLIDHFTNKFKEMYMPHKEVAVDEAMIKFTGRSSLKQYLPMKPIKHGIKVWVLGVDLSIDGIYACGTARKDRVGFTEALRSYHYTIGVCVGTHACLCEECFCVHG